MAWARLLIAFFVMLLPSVVVADLGGLKTIRIHVGGVDADAISCGISEAEVARVIQLPLYSYSGLKLDNDGFEALVAVQLIVAADTSRCVYSVRVEVSSSVLVQLAFAKTPRFEMVMLWSSAFVGTAAKRAAWENIREQLQKASERIAADWQKANPK